MKTSKPPYEVSMKFKKAFHKPGTLDEWAIIFDPWNDLYRMSHDADSPEGCCIYHGMQADEKDQGQPVNYEDLPDGVKRQIVKLESNT